MKLYEIVLNINTRRIEYVLKAFVPSFKKDIILQTYLLTKNINMAANRENIK